ncbi:S24 family peptidase [Delftia sp. NA_296.1]|uniref:S24 family peptidase n=1 Tax=Delftia sp. NA_296.1 TaxID=3415648 RepID=UPI0040455EF6
MTPGDLLQALIKKSGLPSANALAKAISDSTGGAVGPGGIQSAISRLQKGNIPKTETLKPIANYFGLDAAAFQTDESALKCATELGLAKQQEDETEYAGRPRRQRGMVPIVGTAKMGPEGFYEEFSSIPGAGDGVVDYYSDNANAYGLRMKGMSMFPAIRDGWYVIVEPNDSVSEGEYILIKMRNGSKMVKELLFRRSDSIEVMSVNGGERMTLDLRDIEDYQPIGAVVPPSRWRMP